jgi:hypothetical protein
MNVAVASWLSGMQILYRLSVSLPSPTERTAALCTAHMVQYAVWHTMVPRISLYRVHPFDLRLQEGSRFDCMRIRRMGCGLLKLPGGYACYACMCTWDAPVPRKLLCSYGQHTCTHLFFL